MIASRVIFNVKNVVINPFVQNANSTIFLTIKLAMISVLKNNILTKNKDHVKIATAYVNSA